MSYKKINYKLLLIIFISLFLIVYFYFNLNLIFNDFEIYSDKNIETYEDFRSFVINFAAESTIKLNKEKKATYPENLKIEGDWNVGVSI